MIDDNSLPDAQALARSQRLQIYLQQRIHQQGGFISFADFMKIVLYHPDDGYYNATNLSFDKHGDFTTAPELSPLFAECFAKQCVRLFEEIGCSQVLELGAGSGRFAYDLLQRLAQLESLPERYFIYDVSKTLRQKQAALLATLPHHFQQRIVWLSALPRDFHGTIIANEVLDALPVHCFRIEEDGIKERCIAIAQKKLVWHLNTKISAPLMQKVTRLREEYALYPGYESEINLDLAAFLQDITQCLTKGVLLIADYGYGQAEYYHPERRHGTLTCFYRHRRPDSPLALPGLQDITAHVDFTALADCAHDQGYALIGYTTQAGFLLANDLLDRAKEVAETLNPAQQFALHQAIKRLTMPTEMGERIKVMALAKKCAMNPSAFHLQDRRRDL